MTHPVYKIETYTGAVLDHTIEREAVSVYFKEIITDAVGYFAFTVPTRMNGGYYFDDIALNDKIKIYFGFNSVGATPDFIGKVGKISAPLSVASGYLRIISGLSQGEVLLRRFKKNKYYNGIGASTIVTEWANDLSLGTGDITADATAVTLEVRTKSYFDLLRFISDYWASAGSQIKKDFYVDVDNDLVWKARPFRSGASVETLTVGENIISYQVLRDIDAVKNDITVYGAAEKTVPADKEEWTETITDWTADDGSVSLQVGGKPVGGNAIRGYTGAASSTYAFKRDIPRVTIRNVNTLYFWRYNATNCTASNVRLRAPDGANYFECALGTANDWVWKELALGPNQIYDVNKNPNGIWTETGSPNWWDIEYIEFQGTYSVNDRYPWVDVIYFYPERWTDNATDGATPKRDMEVTDDKLHSDSDCQKRAETLLYQKKDSPVQINVTTPGNMNILVGDRLSMTIPAENISAANYDVISVDHSYSNQGFITRATMVNSANIRQPLANDQMRLLGHLNRQLRELSLDEKLVR